MRYIQDGDELALIDENELEDYAMTLAGLILAGGFEIHNEAGDEWATYLAGESITYAVLVGKQAVREVVDRIETAPVFERRFIARRLEQFNDTIEATINR